MIKKIFTQLFCSLILYSTTYSTVTSNPIDEYKANSKPETQLSLSQNSKHLDTLYIIQSIIPPFNYQPTDQAVAYTMDLTFVSTLLLYFYKNHQGNFDYTKILEYILTLSAELLINHFTAKYANNLVIQQGIEGLYGLYSKYRYEAKDSNSQYTYHMLPNNKVMIEIPVSEFLNICQQIIPNYSINCKDLTSKLLNSDPSTYYQITYDGTPVIESDLLLNICTQLEKITEGTYCKEFVNTLF